MQYHVRVMRSSATEWHLGDCPWAGSADCFYITSSRKLAVSTSDGISCSHNCNHTFATGQQHMELRMWQLKVEVPKPSLIFYTRQLPNFDVRSFSCDGWNSKLNLQLTLTKDVKKFLNKLHPLQHRANCTPWQYDRSKQVKNIKQKPN